MAFANPLPWWVLLLVVAAAAALGWHAYRRLAGSRVRRAVLSALRVGALLLIVVFLMRPVARPISDGIRDAVVPVLVDTSRSMGIEDADPRGRLSRLNRARSIVTDSLVPALSRRFHVDVLAFGDALAPTTPRDLAATARRSDLSGALAAVRERYRGRAVAGIVLLSDGGDTNGGGGLPSGEAGAPVFPIGVGSTAVARDREVISVTAAEAVLDGSRVDLDVAAVSHGQGTEPIELRLLENGRPVEVRRATPAAEGSPIHETFQVAPGNAAAVYTVEIPAAAGEPVPENNARSVLVQPPARPRRVLLVEGAPGFEHSFLKRAWAADPGLEIDSVIKKGKNEQGADTFYVQAAGARGDALTSGYPTTAEALFAYDAVVLANVEADQLTRAQLDATRAFVGKRGGGLLVLGAHAFGSHGLLDTSLDEVLPLVLTGHEGAAVPASTRGANRVGLTQSGETHPIMQLGNGPEETRKRWDAIPALASTAPVGGARPGATVLAVTSGPGGASRALIAVQRYGEGRSMVFTGEASWRWRMMMPSTDRSYETFWRQALRWLSIQAPDPVSIAVPSSSSPGEPLAVRMAVRDTSFDAQRDGTVEVRITGPDGRSEQVQAAPDQAEGSEGRYVARVKATESGVYRITAEAHGRSGSANLGTASSAVLVGGADVEMADPRLNLQVLQRVATSSGGRMITASDIPALSAALGAAAPAAALAVRRDLWDTGWSFAAIVLVLVAEWILRRRWGLR